MLGTHDIQRSNESSKYVEAQWQSWSVIICSCAINIHHKAASSASIDQLQSTQEKLASIDQLQVHKKRREWDKDKHLALTS
jgi:hypothetical protein